MENDKKIYINNNEFIIIFEFDVDGVEFINDECVYDFVVDQKTQRDKLADRNVFDTIFSGEKKIILKTYNKDRSGIRFADYFFMFKYNNKIMTFGDFIPVINLYYRLPFVEGEYHLLGRANNWNSDRISYPDYILPGSELGLPEEAENIIIIEIGFYGFNKKIKELTFIVEDLYNLRLTPFSDEDKDFYEEYK